ncbi:MAG TPA: hypothetical protein PKA64_05640 [Myxococcota bacterium]|nr:hypothetical protein [Myxococcota bacterium]
MRKLNLVAPVALLLSCAPAPSTDDGTDTLIDDPDAGNSGRLYDVPMSLVWGWSSETSEGVCVDLKVATNGADVRAWSLRVETEPVIDELYFVEGADIRVGGPASDGALTIFPSIRPELAGDEQVIARFCSRPGVRLLSMESDVTYVDDPDTDPPSLPDPYDMLLDPSIAYGLEYTYDGEENGGDCLRFEVVNLSSVPIIDWGLEVTMAGPVDRTASDGLWFYEGSNPDELIVIPDTDSRTIQPYDAEVGRVCLDPFAEPIAIRGGDAPDP